MNIFSKLSFGLSLLAITGTASATPTIQTSQLIQTGVTDASNLWSADTGYSFSLTTNSADPTYYLNAINLVPQNGFDSNITFDTISQNLGNGFANNNYTLGTALGSNQTYYWSNVLNHGGAFDSIVAPGIYNFALDFVGGATSTASDLLYEQNLQIEIVPKVDVTETTSYDTNVIGQGGTSTVYATMQNNMTRNFVSTTWFTSGGGNGIDFGQLNDQFVGNWFDQTIAGGASRTDMHTTWTASSSQTPGIYTGTTGVVGGLYNGDQLYFATTGNTSIQVVPEPKTDIGLFVLAIGFALYKRRK